MLLLWIKLQIFIHSMRTQIEKLGALFHFIEISVRELILAILILVSYDPPEKSFTKERFAKTSKYFSISISNNPKDEFLMKNFRLCLRL